ncbi:MAG TPA: gluconokinase [Pyrinomonadaceae bacterium]|nr:gluconokinase [Pyrinomonadaceae bacterium]
MMSRVPHDNSDEAAEPCDAQPPFVLALDVGTSSVRAALYDSAAREVAGTQARFSRGFCTTADGGAQVDAEESVEEVLRVVAESLALVPALLAPKIESLAVSCFWHSLVGVGAGGHALTPVYGWADTRAARQAEALRERFDERETHARTGCRFHASYWPAKLLWLQQENADTFRSVERWMSFGELLTLRLCGAGAASVSMASGTGLFDVRACAWDAPLVEFLNLRPAQLPPLADDGESFALSADAAARLPFLKRARVFPAIGDGAANNIGEGCATSARAALMIGTSAAMRVVYEGDAPEAVDPALWLYRASRRRVCVGGALSDGGGLFDWMTRTLALAATTDESTTSVEEFEQAVAALAPDAHGLTVLPFWAGERSTGWHAHAAGALLGLTSHTRPVEIVRAALESVAYRLALVARSLDALAPGAELRASGGALRNSIAWAQIVADVMGRPLRLSRIGEASSRGAALLALEATGAIKSVCDIETPAGETVEPNAAHHEIYARGLERHQKFYDLLIGNQEIARLLKMESREQNR